MLPSPCAGNPSEGETSSDGKWGLSAEMRALLQEPLRRLIGLPNPKLPDGISTDDGIAETIALQEAALRDGLNPTSVTAPREQRIACEQALPGSPHRLALGGGEGEGYPVHEDGIVLLTRLDRDSPGVFLPESHDGVRNAAGLFRPTGIEMSRNDESGDESGDESEPDDPVPAANLPGPDPCPDNLTFGAGMLLLDILLWNGIKLACTSLLTES